MTALRLCLGIVLCGLEGFGSQLRRWRRVGLEPLGPFAPVLVSDQAIYNRLARAAEGMRLFFEQVSGLLTQLFHGMQVQLAAQEGVDPFDVSIGVLVELVPRLLQRGIAPLPVLGRRGREPGLIRPSTRVQIAVPRMDPSWITPAPPQALRPRETARYVQRKCARGPRPSARKAA